MKEEKTPHQIMIERIDRERERIRRLLDNRDGLEAMDVVELNDISKDLRALEAGVRTLAERIEAVAERMTSGE